MPTAWSVLSVQFPPVDPIRLKIRLKPAFGHEKTPETQAFREFWLEVTPGFELERDCNMVYHAVAKSLYFQRFAGFDCKCCIML